MLRIHVDTNSREGVTASVIPESEVPNEDLIFGRRAILFETGFEGEAVLRRGEQWPWVADIVGGTVENLPID